MIPFLIEKSQNVFSPYQLIYMDVKYIASQALS